jgi:hypothetical protein
MSAVLYTDAALYPGGHLIGVADEHGELLTWALVPTANTNIAELRGLLLAVKILPPGNGVILTDSLDGVRFTAGGTKHPSTKNLAELLQVRQEIVDDLPDSWRVAWLPDRFNLAHNALVNAMRTRVIGHVRVPETARIHARLDDMVAAGELRFWRQDQDYVLGLPGCDQILDEASVSIFIRNVDALGASNRRVEKDRGDSSHVDL